MNESELRALAERHGFARIALCAPEPFARWAGARAHAHRTAQHLSAEPLEIAPWARAICVAALPYPLYRPRDGVSVAAYYVEYNAAHARGEEFVRELNARGVTALALEIPAKPAAERAGLGRYGKNGLIQIPGLGGCVMLRCIALGAGFEPAGTYPGGDDAAPADCGACRRCIDACPSGALSEAGFDFTRCLRAHMMQGTPAPEAMRAPMGGRLLGCEECLRACPHNARALERALEPPEALRRVLDIARVLDPDTRAEYMREYGALLGYNYAVTNRVLSQAVLVAANLGMTELRGLIEPLADSPSEAVREHARWALEHMADAGRRERMRMARLIEPSAEYLDSYIEAFDENAAAGITAHRFRDARRQDVLAYFDAYAHERDLPPNRVGAHFYWLVDEAHGRFIGEISVRHRLTEALERYAGHIGYGVRASEQGKGYGTLMLKLALDRARELGIKQVLITCDDDNMASARVMEKNGLVLADTIENEVDGKRVLTRRYRREL